MDRDKPCPYEDMKVFKRIWSKISYFVIAGLLGHEGGLAVEGDEEAEAIVHETQQHVHFEMPRYDSSVHKIVTSDSSATVITWRSVVTPTQMKKYVDISNSDRNPNEKE